MPSPDYTAIQTSDLGKLFSLERTIATRNKRGQPVDKLEQKLSALSKASAKTTQAIADKLNPLEIDSELPIAGKAAEIEKLLAENQVVIVAGETGCGKTTQLPKICLNAGLGRRGKIGHTQPRRVAATSVANRIAEEINTPLGDLVGYSVRFADKTSASTRVKLMTDGILLAELQSDPMLSQYEVIIIDEAHERSLNIDFLLGFLKTILAKRPELKVIVTSATIDPQSFSAYFNDAPVVLVEGRTYPVEVVYQPIEDESDSNDDPVLTGVADAVEQCLAHSPGDILIFSHGENEIKSLHKFLNKQNFSGCTIHPLFARLGIKEQQAIFNPSNKRKIIIATNVAETSLTIPNIVFVIDIGTARVSRYSQRNKIQQLPVEKISRASADQRKGRCGRICPGICFRLYSEEDFLARAEYTEAEISRTNLSSVVLRLKSLKVKDVESFPFIQMPDERQWKVAFNLLFELAAVDETQQLTKLGANMSRLAIDPQLARVLLAPDSPAVEEMLVVSSFLSVRDIRMRPLDKQQKADQCHRQYYDAESDVLSIIKLWQFLDSKRQNLSSTKFKKWCQENFINFVGWLEWRNIYFQTKESIAELGIKTTSQKATNEQVHQALIVGFVGHLLKKSQEHYYQGARGLKVWVHPSSALFKRKQDWLMSAELVETDKIYARTIFPIKPEWLENAVPHLLKKRYYDIHWRKNKGHAAFYLDQSILGLTITNHRLVNSGPIDPELSREIFLLEGLAQDQISQSFPFLSHNREQLDKIQQQQERLRTHEIRISDQALAELYGDLLPKQILSLQSLRKWLKKDWKKRNQTLCLLPEQLINKDPQTLEDYPSEIVIKGVQLPVAYHFSPGNTDDGVVVDIPAKMLVQFEQSDFDWLVPGYLEEKIVAVIKNLPKPVRKQLIPVADTAKQVYQQIISIDYQDKSFKLVLIECLKKIIDVQITVDMINLQDIPNHLKMKFRSGLKKSGGEVLSEQLSVLKNKTITTKKEADNSQSENQTKNKVSNTWPTNFKGLEFYQEVASQAVRIFSAVTDNTTGVVIKEYSSLVEARFYHQRGLARLLLLTQSKRLRNIKNSWPDRKELERLNLRFGGFSALIDWAGFSIALSLIRSQKQDVETEADYREIENNFNQNLAEKLADILSDCLKLLRQTHDIYLRLSEFTSEVYQESVDDIKTQLSQLWSAERILQQQDNLLVNYSRYLEAINHRMVRIDENFPKEQQSLDNWFEWQQWWQELNEYTGNVASQLKQDDLFWMLQEFRVSLFAPQLKNKTGISAKKLQKQFEKLEQSIA